jgi:glycosyltransferase involved in cell wall biosynthesis
MLMVTVETRYLKYQDDYFVKGIENENFFERYTEVFGEVCVIARVNRCKYAPSGYKKVANKNIHFLPVYTTSVGLSQFFKLMSIINENREKKLIIRTPGFFAYFAFVCCVLIRKEYYLEVVANPLQEAQSTTSNDFFNSIFSLILPNIFRFQLRLTKGASFVTEHEIQDIYLSSKNKVKEKYSFSYSSINLDRKFYISDSSIDERFSKENTYTKLLFVGVLERPFKGLDTFINILKLLPERYKGVVIGDGKLLNHYKSLASSLIKSERIQFLGYVSDEDQKVRLYRECDIFVLCSRREGLPRVLIEAMANGLPSISSEVSGSRELLSTDFIFPIDDAAAACELIMRLTDESLSGMAYDNKLVALKYSLEKLMNKRGLFYSFIKR